MSVLSEILASKRTEVDSAKRRIPRKELEHRLADLPSTRDFSAAIASPRPDSGGTIRNPKSEIRNPKLIAEIKKASPSKGIIREDFDPVEIAHTYAANGAACLSVLTDEPYFQGRLSYLAAIREAVPLPLLRKDFIIDDYQLIESRVAGADAILLIAAALTETQLEWMLDVAAALNMAVMVEVHDREELDLALATEARIIGINNRDLHTFRTTLQTTLDLLPHIPPDRIVVSESGINYRADVEKLAGAGVHAILVGEALMREPDIAAKMHELLHQQ